MPQWIHQKSSSPSSPLKKSSFFSFHISKKFCVTLVFIFEWSKPTPTYSFLALSRVKKLKLGITRMISSHDTHPKWKVAWKFWWSCIKSLHSSQLHFPWEEQEWVFFSQSKQGHGIKHLNLSQGYIIVFIFISVAGPYSQGRFISLNGSSCTHLGSQGWSLMIEKL